MRTAYDIPGSTMLTFSLPNADALTAGIVGDPSPDVYGTDPASAVRDSLAFYAPRNAMVPGISGPTTSLLPTEALGKIGRAVAVSLVALILVALGVWIVVKQ